MENQIFNQQLERIKLITGKQTQTELAALFGIRRAAVSDAKRRGKIPPAWLVTLMRVKRANPEWILTGNGPVFPTSPSPEPRYETGAEAVERRADEEALRRLYSRMLAEEPARRT